MDLTSQELSSFAAIALKAALEAGAILEHYWGNVHQVHSKDGAGNLVTEADQASEKCILEILQDLCPQHAVLAEESGTHDVKGTEFLWAVDPLDGTTNYAHQLPIVSVSIGLLYRGSPVVGVVYNPIQKNLFQATLGGGAFLDGKPIYVSKVKNLSESLLVSGFPYHRRETEDNNYTEFCRLTDITQGVRRLGSAALDLAHVAAGRYEGYWESGIQAWDVVAGCLLVQEAGGRVTAYDGSRVDYFSGRLLATNGMVHDQLSDELARIKQKKTHR